MDPLPAAAVAAAPETHAAAEDVVARPGTGSALAAKAFSIGPARVAALAARPLLATLILLAGCAAPIETASPPEEIRFDLSPPAAPSVPRRAAALEVHPFDATEPLAEERAILYRDAAEPRGLRPHPAALWSAPPAELLRQATTRCLASSGLFGSVFGAGEPLQARWRLQASVAALEFSVVPPDAGAARIALDVTLIDNETETTAASARLVAIEAAVGTTPADAVEAFDRAKDALCASTVEALAAALPPGSG